MRVFDIDDDTRLLTGVPGADAVVLAEIDPESGESTELARVPALGAARYLPGERSVVIEHDQPPRLSVLSLKSARRKGTPEPRPLVGEPDHACELLEALPGRVVYRTNQRNRLQFDVVIRNVFMGEEQAVFEGGEVREAAVSPDSRYVAVRLPDRLLLVATMPETEEDHVLRIADEDPNGGHTHLHWLPDSVRLIATRAGDRGTDVVRFDPHEGWRTLVADAGHGAVGLPSPDGLLLAVIAGRQISLHSAESGQPLRRVELPAPVPPAQVRWSPNSVALGLSTEDNAHLVLAAKAELRTFA